MRGTVTRGETSVSQHNEATGREVAVAKKSGKLGEEL